MSAEAQTVLGIVGITLLATKMHAFQRRPGKESDDVIGHICF
jgi:hypothetical protein